MKASARDRAAVLGAVLFAGIGIAAAAVPVLSARPAHAAVGVHAEEIVRFPSADGDLTGGAPTMLSGRLLRPSGSGPHPAVVMLHGCGGLYARSGRVSPRHVWWATHLQRQGYEVLMVDSFGPRDVEEVCTTALKDRTVRATVERKLDAWGALAFLRRRPEVDHGRIGLIGWSQGAGTVLAAYGAGEDGPAGTDEGGFRAAVAFYPGCRTSLSDEDWQPDGPLLLLVGDKDDWTPPQSCIDLAARDGVKDKIDLVVYPDTYHGFDAPDAPVRTRDDVASAPDGKAHVGTNEDARSDAIRRVTNFFREKLGG
ncbi:dienelactone hydrolase family protein [Azospirillum picis]|uniref:Dienelactone hydrolase n=1 Tax=Azospirillum picis TaxID=488438 RepID=A0ABU0MJV3_9PROT|nr:dienelactone hydrolase family protein [Azospirillum picis]MBP2300023.1 dienelactone hydrolase [Azospirillum picis]MDQ0533739.1 dienelactone hydrolase [Azospirillum picis]